MGLFRNKKKARKSQLARPIDETTDGVQRFFDGYFQQLQRRGQTYFQHSIDQSTAAFKKDLDDTIDRANAELKTYITERLDREIAGNDKAIREAQAHALHTMSRSVRDISEKHRQLSDALQGNLAKQQAVLTRMFQEYASDMKRMKDAQARAISSLEASTQALELEQQQASQTLQARIAREQAVLMEAFEENMALVIEHYLTEALGDQYDLKEQLPGIIKQLEDNKQAIMDDMKL